MIVLLSEFQKYSNVFNENEELQKSFIYSANNIVSDYLGYDPEFKLLNPKTGLIEDISVVLEIIKLTVMRIAAILQTESDSNIGITSKSFGDSGSRTFINTTNFDKYLIQLSQYRVIRI